LRRPRIALVEASSPSTNVFSRAFLPRVGISGLGATLDKLGYECELWFQTISPVDVDHLRRFDIVGISCLTCEAPNAYRLADSVRHNGTTVVIGGPHATFNVEEALEHSDYVVLGQGDASFPALVNALAREEVPEAVPGLAFQLPGGAVHRTGKAEVVDFASLLSPDFSLSPQVKRDRIPPIVVTSRGCPHDCVFCSVTTVFGRRYRFKSNEQVIAELGPIQKRSICFGDDNFCANRKRTKSLLRDMITQGVVPLRWSGQMTVDAASDQELLGLMQETRCRIMYVGIESIHTETLETFGKVHSVGSIGRCIENLHRHDIGVHGMFVIGVDDTPDSVAEIVDYAMANDIDTIQLFALTTFPGTAAYQQLRGRVLHREWEYYDGMHMVVEPRECTAYDLQMAIVQGMQRFYGLRRALGSYRRGRAWRMKYRLGGHFLLRAWVRENAQYLERLRTSHYHSAETEQLARVQGI